MFGIHRESKDVTYSALIDIGSGTVGVAIVESRHAGDTPKLLYTHRSTMRISEHESSPTLDYRRVHEALISASLLLSQEGYRTLHETSPRARIKNLFVTCSAPWAYTLVRNVRYENEKSFKISQSILDDLIATAESSILEHLKENTDLDIDTFEIVERTTLDITVNDYHIKNPINSNGSIVALSHVAGVVPKEIIQSIEEVRDKLFPNTELRLHTSMLAMFCEVRELFPRLTNYAIFNVTGETTECAIVENGSFTENTYISAGNISVIRDITQKTKRPVGDIETHLHSYGEGEQPISELAPYIEAYKTKVKAGIEKVLTQRMFPTNIIVTAHRPYTSFFSRTIKEASEEALQVVPIQYSIEASLIDDITNGSGDDVYLALYARFFHKVHSCGDPIHV